MGVRAFGVTTGLVTVAAMAGLGALLGGLVGPAGVIIGAMVCAAVGLPLAVAHVTTRSYPPTLAGLGLVLVDHSWSLLNTVAAAVCLDIHLLVGHSIARARSRHTGRVHVVQGPSPRWAMAIGHVVAGGNAATDRHEAVHVAQGRWLGALYLPLVGLNWLLFALVPVWLLYHDHERAPINGVRRYFECGVYPHLWNEVYAYRVEGTPPR